MPEVNQNPYSAKNKRIAITAKTQEPITAGGAKSARAGRINPRTGKVIASHSEPLVNGAGDFNAGSKRDLMQAIATFQKHLAEGSVQRHTDTPAEVKAEREQAFQEALADRSGQSWQVLGEVIGDEIWETLGRDGFARKTLLIKPLGKGETGRLRVRKKDVLSFFVTVDPNVIASQVRQFYIYPPKTWALN